MHNCPRLSIRIKISKCAKSWFSATLSLIDTSDGFLFPSSWTPYIFLSSDVAYIFASSHFFWKEVWENVSHALYLTTPFSLGIHFGLKLIALLFNVWRWHIQQLFSYKNLFHLCFCGLINHNLKYLFLASFNLLCTIHLVSVSYEFLINFLINS